MLENFFKVKILQKSDISAIGPELYQKRFLNFVDTYTKPFNDKENNNGSNNNNKDDVKGSNA